MTIDIRSMGYARVASTDLEAWRHFGTKVLGLAEGRGPTEENLYFRIDQVSSRVVVFPSDVDRLECVGWELADHDALQRAREHLEKAGVEITEGTPEELADRRVQELIRFTDPFDNVFELFHGITYESRPVVTPYAATFVTGDQGMGHVVIPVDDDVEALHFYRDVLGFRLRDSMSMPGEFVGKEPGSKVWLRFLGVNPRHHSLAFLPMPNPSRCVHIMFEVEKLDDVGRALERVTQAQGPALGHARPAHERRDGVVLRAIARRLRHRVRLRGPDRQRRALGGAGVDRGLLLGARLRAVGLRGCHSGARDRRRRSRRA